MLGVLACPLAHARVSGDLVDPGAERTTRPECLPVLEDPYEDVLGQVLAHLTVTGHSDEEGEELRVVPFEQDPEIRHLAFAHALLSSLSPLDVVSLIVSGWIPGSRGKVTRKLVHWEGLRGAGVGQVRDNPPAPAVQLVLPAYYGRPTSGSATRLATAPAISAGDGLWNDRT